VAIKGLHGRSRSGDDQEANERMDVERLSRIDRVNIVGTSGSGKSTFGRKLAAALELPFYEMDQLYWLPDWQEPEDAEFLPQVEAVVSQRQWVLDGNYSRTNFLKWNRSQLVVWLDMSRLRTFCQIVSRSLRRSLSQQEVWQGTGNRETLSRSFLSRDSVILWSLTSYGTNRKRYAAAMQSPKYDHIWFLRLTSPAESQQVLSAAVEAAALRRKRSESAVDS
jgi:adenylate kinase family enzyme